MQVKVKLHINGHIFTESVATDDVFVAEDIALARNPGAEIISSNLSIGWW
tara:strand:+ start:489 stop:638 length:150 start_codon:yes stop_codon:yes gene_type:complete